MSVPSREGWLTKERTTGRFDGEVAFITGAARGQGRSHALALAREGADIVAVDIAAQMPEVGCPMGTEADLAETVEAVEALDRRIVAGTADVRGVDSMRAVYEQGVSELGRLDIVTADAGGRIAASTVTTVGSQIASGLGTTATTLDVAPLTPADPNGVGLFYLVIISSIGGYLTITVLAQAFPAAGRRIKLLTTAIASVLTPLIATTALSFSVGIFGMDFGQLIAVLGVDALYVFTVSLIALTFTEVLGQAAIIGVLVVVLALNFPSTGGSVPESMLPPFWQAIHAVWFGSGTLETFRFLIFFGGNGFGWPFLRLCIWLVASAAAFVGANAWSARRGTARASQPADEPVDHVAGFSGATPVLNAG